MECEQQHRSSQELLIMKNIKPTADPLLIQPRPLMLRPRTAALCGSDTVQFPTISPTTYRHHHRFPQNPNLTVTAWKNPLSLSGVCDYGVKRGMVISGGGVPLVSTRWNPTPEQVQALEEMYRKGTRTPSAEQIQQIATKLRRFGKIEGKNVFYWFQNHKARERQKRRRHEMEAAHLPAYGRKIVRHDQTTEETQSSALSRRHLEIEHPKKLQPTSSNCSTAIQHSATSSSPPVVEELCQKDKWTLQAAAAAAAKSSTDPFIDCCQLDLSSCLSPNSSMDINKANITENENQFVEFNLFCPTHVQKDGDDLTNGIGENQTLELFPVKAGNDSGNTEGSSNVGTSRLAMAPAQFFEFLPTRN